MFFYLILLGRVGKSGLGLVWIGGKKLMPLSFFLPCRRSAFGWGGGGKGCSVPGVVLSGVKIDGFR